MATATTSSGAPTLADTLFQRGLDDLVRHLRASPDLPSAVSRAMSDSLREVLSTDLDTKSVALLKLTYLHSLHLLPLPTDAAFHALHLLPSPSPLRKRLAYLCASLSFHSLPDALLLSTNQLRKDLSSPSPIFPSFALELLSHSSSPDLARNLAPDLLPLLSSSRPSICRRALAAMPCILLQHPDHLRAALPHIMGALSSSTDPRVLAASISVIAELSSRDPRTFLPLAPELYKVLVDSRNNWVLIKVLKVFSHLSPIEPRLGRKIVDPVCEHMRRSPAKSLVFECTRLVAENLSEFQHAMQLAVEKMKEFLSEDDLNLRYLGLQGLSMLRRTCSWAVDDSRQVVVKLLDDRDINIQREALSLVMALVSDSNVVEVCDLLVKQAARSDPLFANEILGAILTTCAGNFYELIVDFEWYVSLLGVMSRNPHCAKGEEIERQLVDIGMRVKDARMELVNVSRDLLIDPALLGNMFLYRVLSAAAWIAGEYVEFSRNPIELVEALMQPRTSLLPMMVREVYIQAVFKIIIFCYSSYLEGAETNHPSSQIESCEEIQTSEVVKHEVPSDCLSDRHDETDIKCAKAACQKVGSFSDSSKVKEQLDYTVVTSMLNMIKEALLPLSASDEVGVQERSRNVLGLIHILQGLQSCDLDKEFPVNVARTFEFVRLMQDSISEELGPVPTNAQDRVPVPDGISFLKDLSEIQPILGDSSVETISSSTFAVRVHHTDDVGEESEPSTESTSLLAEHRKRHGLYYIPVEKGETVSNNYPAANDLVGQGDAITGNAIENLLKLTQKSQDHQRSRPVKSRPTVIKLDDENCPPISCTKSIEPGKGSPSYMHADDIASNMPSSSEEKSSRSSRRTEKETFINQEDTAETKQSWGATEPGSSRSKPKKHGKKKHKRVERNVNPTANDTNSSVNSGYHDLRQKHVQMTDDSSKLTPQMPFQDFLL